MTIANQYINQYRVENLKNMNKELDKLRKRVIVLQTAYKKEVGVGFYSNICRSVGGISNTMISQFINQGRQLPLHTYLALTKEVDRLEKLEKFSNVTRT